MSSAEARSPARDGLACCPRRPPVSSAGRSSWPGSPALLGTARMVTVVGPAGVGKTRLSLRAAALAAERFTDGVWLADLAGISDLTARPARRGRARPAGEDDAAAPRLPARQEAAAGPRHVRAPGRRLRGLRGHRAAGRARGDLLATSRQPLDAQGEHAFPLPPLPAEDDARPVAQRAAAVSPGSRHAAGPADDGGCVSARRHPLGIELAAVRCARCRSPSWQPAGIGIRMLTVSRRGTSPGTRPCAPRGVELPAVRARPSGAVGAAFVFAGTFDVRGAEQVCAEDALPQAQIVHALVGLVDKSVVLRDTRDPSRYRLLAALREFGRTGSRKRASPSLPRRPRRPLRRHGQGLRRAVPRQPPVL